MKTAADLETLKAQWLQDPAWDIEDTEGFEAFRDELREFHVRMNEVWSLKNAIKDIDKEMDELTAQLNQLSARREEFSSLKRRLSNELGL